MRAFLESMRESSGEENVTEARSIVWRFCDVCGIYLRLAQGRIDRLFAETGETAEFLQRTGAANVTDAIEDPHHTV